MGCAASVSPNHKNMDAAIVNSTSTCEKECPHPFGIQSAEAEAGCKVSLLTSSGSAAMQKPVALVHQKSGHAYQNEVYIVDCGSGSTVIYKFACHEDGSIFEAHPSFKITDPEHLCVPQGNNPNSVTVGRDVLKPGQFDGFLKLFVSGLQGMGWQEGDTTPIFLGATGGVRKLVLAGFPEEKLSEFENALKTACGQNLRFEVITGDEEADCEHAAAKCAFEPLFQASNKTFTGLASGGGSSCQFAYGSPLQKHSLPLDMIEPQDSIRKSGESAVSPVQAKYDEEIEKTCLKGLEGCWVGIAMLEDLSQLGFSNRFISAGELRALLPELQKGLFARSGPYWDSAVGKWKDRVDKLWVIGLVNAVRFEAILKMFSDKAEFYFASQAPISLLRVTWPLGWYVLKKRLL